MMNSVKRTIVLTGGGTAGHVLPNLAILPYLRKHFSDIYYIGGTNTNEQKMVEAEGIKFFPLECVKLRRGLNVRNIGKNMLIPFGYSKSVKTAKEILHELKPDIVFSKGGFVALPVVRAAKKIKIPIVLHESDATMGLANKLSLKCADKVCTTFNSKYIVTGSPIRQKIYAGNSSKVTLGGFGSGHINNKRRLLVVGGSLGASKINQVVRSSIDKLCEIYDVIHICGRGKIDESIKKSGYKQLEFCDDIENYFAWADVVVSRAGSNALCELMVLGKPTLFIPLSTGRGDQIDNVNEVLKHNACGVLYEQKISPDSFVGAVNSVWENEVVYIKNSKSVVKDGTKDIVQTIYSVVCNI